MRPLLRFPVRPMRPGITATLALALLALLAAGCGDDPTPTGPGDDPTSATTPATPSTADADAPATPGALGFTDITASAGLDFRYENGAAGEKLLPETMGGGCAFLDHDNDGDADIALVGGMRWPWDDRPGGSSASSLALYENDGTGAFSDVTVSAGLSRQLQGMGPAVGDIDGDGDSDLYVTAVGENVLFRNEGGFFVDGTSAAGVGGDPEQWSTAAGFLDIENDGDLDLLVGSYVQWSREIDVAGDRRLVGIPGRAYAPPMAFEGSQPSLFVNRGDGVFDEGAADAGLHQVDDGGQPIAKTLAYLFVDLDNDLDTDVFVANDTTRNQFFVNDGTGRFSEQALDLGLAYDRMGNPTGAMGVDGTLFGTGDEQQVALFVGNFADEASSAYVSPRQDPFFQDETLELGLGAATRNALTFGLLAIDVDLDGHRDLLQANGHIEPGIDAAPGEQTYAQAPQLFRSLSGEGPTRFEQVPAAQIPALSAPMVGRGAASADIDGDGDLDLLLTEVAGPPRLLRNEVRNDVRAPGVAGPHWLRVVLKGRPGSPSAIGAQVELNVAGRVQRRRVDTTRSYLSQCERPLVFGLGGATAVDTVSVRWPDGTLTEVTPEGVDRTLTVVQPVGPGEVQRVLNRAKAQLETGKLQLALASLRTAVELAPESAASWRNLARAELAANDAAAALVSLDTADALEPGDVASAYLRAMALLRTDRPAEALPLLEDVARRDPATAAVRFQLAMALQAVDRGDDALVQLRETVRLDPAHGAAFYQLAVASRRAGDMDAFRSANRDFLRLRQLYGDAYKTPLSLEACVFTLAEPAGEAIAQTTGRVAPAEPMGVTFTLDDSLLGAPVVSRASAILSMDDAGRYSVASVRSDGVLELLEPADGGGFTARTLLSGLGDLSGARGLIVGNFLDDTPDVLVPGSVPPRRPDLFVFGPSTARLLQQQEDGGFVDVTAGSGLEEAFGARARWVDHEHDGDLDLVVAGANGLRVYANTNDGRFVPTDEVPTLDTPAHDLLAVDFDDNGAVDFAVLTGSDGPGSGPTERIRNRRAGRYEVLPDPPGPWPAARRALADDLDADGWVDTVLVHERSVQFVFDGVAGEPLAVDDLVIADAVLADPDGNAWLDLVLVGQDDAGQGRVVLLANRGRGTWADVSDTTLPAGIGDMPPLSGVIAADLDADGDSDLLVRDADDRLRTLRNDGGEAGGLLKLRLVSLMSPSGGLGARVELRQRDFFAARHLQDEWPVEIGLGGRRHLDSVLAIWPYGVVDSRTDVDVGREPLSIVVVEKADTGSCPFLYVWDGTTRRFINDMVGSGATDLPLSREQDNPINPHEIIGVGPIDDFPLVDGAWAVSITSELREAAYFDEAVMLVVDHPEGTELASNHRLRPPPFPDNDVLVLGARTPLRSAVGSDGIDRTAALLDQDGVHGPPGPILPPPIRGQCKAMTLELDFGPMAVDRPLVLALSGFIEFGTASTMIGMSQRRDVEVLWPALEVRDGDGAWHPLDVVVGLPGGKVRTLTVELDGLLPAGADRLRLTTTFQLHWDRAALFERVPLADDALVEVRPRSAELRWRGFSELAFRAPGQPRFPDYDVVSQTPAFRVCLEGWHTAYGDVLPLLLAEDGKIIVLNSGDEMLLELPGEGLPPVPAGHRRSLMWRSVGYNKEADPNNSSIGNVWPLGPDTTYGRTDEEEDAWRLKYNTRWIPSDRFDPHAQGTR